MPDFAALHRAGAPLVLPNAWDVASAAALVRAGFPAVGTTSLGVAASNGLPDGEGATAAATVELVGRLAALPCHVTADIEDGSVATALAVAARGAVGVNVEDGRGSAGLAAAGEQAELIRQVKTVRPDLFVNARTDTHWLRTGATLSTTLERLTAYLAAGADGVFVPGLAAPADIAEVVRAVHPAPLNVLFLPGRHTVVELTDLGVRRISMGSLPFRAALGAAVRAALAVAGHGELPAELPTYAEVQALHQR